MSVDPVPDPTASFAAAGRMVDAFEAGRRARAAADAAELRLLAEAAAAVARPPRATVEQTRRAELDRRALIADLATSTRTSEWTVTRLLTEATDLCMRFAAGVDALARGDISRQHLAVIHEAGRPIGDDVARAEFVALAVDRAARLTPGRLAPALRAIAERFRERTLDERRHDAAATRRVDVTDLDDGMASLLLTAEATLVHGIHDRLTAQAHSVIAAREPAGDGIGAPDRTDSIGAPNESSRSGQLSSPDEPHDLSEPGEPADTRTMDQLRADILTDILLTAGPEDCVAGTGLAAIRATVQVTVPVLTMAGGSDEPCLLAGYGPIDTETARTLAGTTTGWERVMTSPVTGAVLAVDRYRPGSGLGRFLAARDEHCRFPGCRRPVWRCDIDHTVDAAHGGPTCHDNLAHLCRRHHVLKHVTPWTVEQTSPGVLVWTSPTGRRHTDRPEPTIRFVPDEGLLDRRRVMREPWLLRRTTHPEPPEPHPSDVTSAGAAIGCQRFVSPFELAQRRDVRSGAGQAPASSAWRAATISRTCAKSGWDGSRPVTDAVNAAASSSRSRRCNSTDCSSSASSKASAAAIAPTRASTARPRSTASAAGPTKRSWRESLPV